MDQIQSFVLNNVLLFPLVVFLGFACALLLREDRGAFIFEKRTEVAQKNRRLYVAFHVLKYAAILLGLLNPYVRFG